MNEEEKFRLLNFKVYEKRIADVWKILQSEKIEAILIKGWAAAQNYPKPFMRDIGDIDVAVNPEQYEGILNLQEELIGAVDFHEGLRKLDLLDWKTLRANSRLVNCGETEIRILGFEDNLRVLTIHWLADGGYNRQKLWDIYYAAENRPADFDWDYFLNSNGKTRRKWLTCGIGLAREYLGLDIEKTPIAEEAKDIPDWITKTVEKEWESSVQFSYLHSNLSSGRQFFEQLKKRIPPNPIQATVNMEGEFDNRTRIFYQIGDLFSRLPASVSRVSQTIFGSLNNR